MPIQEFTRADEKRNVRGESNQHEERWLARGPNITITELLNRAEAETDLLKDGIERKRHSYEQIAVNHWAVTAHYDDQSDKQREQDPSGEIRFSFEDTVVLGNVKHAIETLWDFPDPNLNGKERDLKDAINVQGIGKDTVVEGTDIYLPESGFTYTLTADEPFFTEAYRVLLSRLRTTVNDKVWKGYDRGEVLFMGTQGDVNTSGNSSIALRFSVRPNITIDGEGAWTYAGIAQPGTFKVAGRTLTAPAGEEIVLEGWHYVDTTVITKFNDASNRTEQSPENIRFLRNYHYANFDLFNLP